MLLLVDAGGVAGLLLTAAVSGLTGALVAGPTAEADGGIAVAAGDEGAVAVAAVGAAGRLRGRALDERAGALAGAIVGTGHTPAGEGGVVPSLWPS